MKNLILLLSISVFFVSCNKSVDGCTDSTATNYNANATDDNGSCTYPPAPASTTYSLEFLAYVGSPSTPWYTDMKIVINDDTLSSLMTHTTTKTTADIEGDFINNGTAYPSNGISYPFDLNVVYTIKVIDGPTNTLLATTIGQFETEPAPATYDRDIFFNITSETDNTPGCDAVFGAGTWNVHEGIGEGNVEDKYFFVFGLEDY